MAHTAEDQSLSDVRARYAALGLVYYTPAEEVLNTLTHALGVLAAAVLAVCMLRRATTPMSVAVVVLSCALWGLQFGISAAYHGCRHLPRKAVWRRVDYAAVSLNVLACGTAFSLLYGRVYGYVALGLGLAIAVAMLVWCLVRFERARPWAVAAAFVVGGLMFGSFLSAYFAPGGIVCRYPVVWLHLAGLSCSLAGAAIFGVHRPFVHSVFHVLVLAGPILCAVGNLYQLT